MDNDLLRVIVASAVGGVYWNWVAESWKKEKEKKSVGEVPKQPSIPDDTGSQERG